MIRMKPRIHIRHRLIWAVGSWRVRHEGWEQAEQASPFWDRVVTILMGGKDR